MSTTTQYPMDLSLYRRYMREIAYGYYTRAMAPAYGFSHRTHDTIIRLLKLILDTELFHNDGPKSGLPLFYDYSAYKNTMNDLHPIYSAKNLKWDTTLEALLLLHALSKSPEPLSITALIDACANSAMDFVATAEQMTSNKKLPLLCTYQRTRNAAENLCTAGLVRKQKDGKNKIFYSLSPLIIDKLTAEENRALQRALLFYGQIALVTIPSYSIIKKLAKLLDEPPQMEKLYFFQNSNITRLLDNDILSLLFAAKAQKREVEITYETKKVASPKVEEGTTVTKEGYQSLKIKGFLHSIHSNFIYNREYIHLYSTRKKQHSMIHKIRLDRVVNVTITSNKESSQKLPPLKIKRKQELSFSLLLPNDKKEKNKLIKRLNQSFSSYELILIKDSPTQPLYSIKAADLLALVPTLRTFFPFLQLPKDTTYYLQDRLITKAKEALAYYEPTI